MIARMCRRLVSALLVLGWISLSGFDVVEDLDEAPGRPAFSATPDSASAGTKRSMGSLANNIIESASRTKQPNVALVTLMATISDLDLLLEFRKHSQLHKLHRVFLI
jgi:hypothetical protein